MSIEAGERTRPGRSRSTINLVLVASMVLAAAPTSARADEGRFAIYQPTTIDEPGSYVLNRDIFVMSGDGIVIAASDVDLDLNGYALRSQAPGGSLIRITDGSTSIRIRNGRLLGSGQTTGVLYGTDLSVPPISLRLEDLEIINQSVGVSLASAGTLQIIASDISHCTDTCVIATGAALAGRIVDSRMADGQNEALGLTQTGMEIRGNLLSTAPASFANFNRPGLYLGGQGGIVQGNVITSIDAPPDATVGILLVAQGAQVLDNDLDRHSNGIRVVSSGNWIAGNVIRRSGFNGTSDGDGILCQGTDPSHPASGNLIEVNLIDDSLQCALAFTPASSSNAYRANMLWSSGAGPVCAGGTGNTDEGGNL